MRSASADLPAVDPATILAMTRRPPAGFRSDVGTGIAEFGAAIGDAIKARKAREDMLKFREQSRQDQQAVNAVQAVSDAAARRLELQRYLGEAMRDYIANGKQLWDITLSHGDRLSKVINDRRQLQLVPGASLHAAIANYAQIVGRQADAAGARSAQVREQGKTLTSDAMKKAVLQSQNRTNVSLWDASATNAPLVQRALEDATGKAAGYAPVHLYSGDENGDRWRKDISDAAFGHKYLNGAVDEAKLKDLFGITGEEWSQRRNTYITGGKPMDDSLSATSGALAFSLASGQLGENLAAASLPAAERPQNISPDSIKAIGDTRLRFRDNMVKGLNENIDATLPGVRKALMDKGVSLPEGADAIAVSKAASALLQTPTVSGVGGLADKISGAVFLGLPLPGKTSEEINASRKGDPVINAFVSNVQLRDTLAAASPDDIIAGASKDPAIDGALGVLNNQMSATGKYLVSGDARLRVLPGVSEAYDYKAVRQQYDDPATKGIAASLMQRGSAVNTLDATNKAMSYRAIVGALIHDKDVGQLRIFEAADPASFKLAIGALKPDLLGEQSVTPTLERAQQIWEKQYAGDYEGADALRKTAASDLREDRLRLAIDKFGTNIKNLPSAVRVRNMNPADRTPEDNALINQVLNDYGWDSFFTPDDVVHIEQLFPEQYNTAGVTALDTQAANIKAAQDWAKSAAESLVPPSVTPQFQRLPQETIDFLDKAFPGAGRFMNDDNEAMIAALEKARPQFEAPQNATPLPAVQPQQVLQSKQSQSQAAGAPAAVAAPMPTPAPQVPPPAAAQPYVPHSAYGE